jgi:hypothetical protein
MWLETNVFRYQLVNSHLPHFPDHEKHRCFQHRRKIYGNVVLFTSEVQIYKFFLNKTALLYEIPTSHSIPHNLHAQHTSRPQ